MEDKNKEVQLKEEEAEKVNGGFSPWINPVDGMSPLIGNTEKVADSIPGGIETTDETKAVGTL